MNKDNNKLGEFTLQGIPPMPRGVPQIEIAYDLDSNGILNVSACEKSTGKSDNITVTNDKGRLSKEDIEKMLEDAEKFKEDDEKAKELIDCKNNYESLVFQMKSALNDEKLAEKIDDSMKDNLNKIIDEHTRWLDNNQMASKEEYDDKKREFETEMKPLQEIIMSGMQGMQGMQGMPDMPDMPKAPDSPKSTNIEDVD